MTHFHYFAYGSNMSVRRLQQRTPSAKLLGVAILDAHVLAFNKHSLIDGSAKCTIARSSSDCVYGVLYRINTSELEILDSYEGRGRGYDRIFVDVKDAQGVQHRAQTYLGTRLLENIRPYSWYHHHVLVGAREARLPGDYIRAIENIAVIEDPDRDREAGELAIYG